MSFSQQKYQSFSNTKTNKNQINQIDDFKSSSSKDQKQFSSIIIPLQINKKVNLKDTKNIDKSIHSNQSNQNDQSQTSFQKEELLELEIKQLKRQNNFLKKKIQDLNDQFKQDGNGYGFVKPQYQNQNFNINNKNKKIVPGKIKTIEEKNDCLHKSLQIFYQEINNLLKSVAELFKIKSQKSKQLGMNLHLIQRKTDLQPKKSQILSVLNQNQRSGPLKIKNDLLKKDVLNKKLQRILLESEQKRYLSLLDLFMEYYQCKTQHETKAIEYIDQMTQKAISLNKQILQRGHNKRLLKESQFTSSHTFDLAQNLSIQNIKKKKQFLESIQKIQGISKTQELIFDDYQMNKN